MPYELVQPSGPDTMTRLAQLDACCDVKFFSMRVGYQRFWTVVVRSRDGSNTRFERTALSLKLAVFEAIAEADRRRMVGRGTDL